MALGKMARNADPSMAKKAVSALKKIQGKN
jgi:hypothetical protein